MAVRSGAPVSVFFFNNINGAVVRECHSLIPVHEIAFPLSLPPPQKKNNNNTKIEQNKSRRKEKNVFPEIIKFMEFKNKIRFCSNVVTLNKVLLLLANL